MECVAGMCGFSMGGVHASMVASLYPGNVACTPLLAPRSASGAFCHGALRSATSWAPLTAVVDEKQQVTVHCQLVESGESVISCHGRGCSDFATSCCML